MSGVVKNNNGNENEKIKVAIDGKLITLEEYINTSQNSMAQNIKVLCGLGEVKYNDVQKLFLDDGGAFARKEEEIIEILRRIYPRLCEKHNNTPGTLFKIDKNGNVQIDPERAEALGIDSVGGKSGAEPNTGVENILSDQNTNEKRKTEYKYADFDEETAQRFSQVDTERDLTTLNRYETFNKYSKDITLEEQMIIIEDEKDAEFLIKLFEYLEEPNQNEENVILEQFGDSKYLQDIVNQTTGVIDIKKAQEFKDAWIKTENQYMEKMYLKNAFLEMSEQMPDFEKMGEVAKKDFALIIARGYFAENEFSKENFKKICKRLGIQNNEADVI